MWMEANSQRYIHYSIVIIWITTLTWSKFASFVICSIKCNWQGMFNQASSFNGDISSWDVSKVNYMAVSIICQQCVSLWKMFRIHYSILIIWITTLTLSKFASFVICSIHCNWQGMFYQASSFNGDISSWNVSKVTSMKVSITCEQWDRHL